MSSTHIPTPCSRRHFGAGFILLLCSLLLIPGTVSGQSRKSEKQRADALSYQPAGGEAVSSPKKADQTLADPNATIVRGAPRAKLSPAEQLAYTLNERKSELQGQVDALGSELKTARGSRAKKITKELDLLADQIAVIDRKLEALPKTPTIPEVYSGNQHFGTFVDSLVDRRIEEEGYTKGSSETPATDSYTAPAKRVSGDYKVLFRVQLAVTSRANEGAFSELGGVQMLQRPDGKYAYYYGGYPSYSEAQAACRRLRGSYAGRYRDAFVVAMQGSQRIPVEEATRILGTLR